ncbi:MAG: ribosomal protein L7/L12, partial [Candidatus Yanofskybacteria bacterium]|nr:ribosomal protein L7/L12 [Candidatus Yanofskybacteria bacterium]
MEKETFVQQIETMTVAELNDLVKALEEKFGVSAAAFAAAAPAAGGAAAEEEKDSYTIVLKEITGLGLKEVKDMTDKVPATVKEGVKKSDADEIFPL